jgi:AcrR family transcriptional regulator
MRQCVQDEQKAGRLGRHVVKRSKWASDLHWVREGQQDRSRKTQAALLDSAEELFAEHGIGGATIADISAAAGCSIGAFYHHYQDKRSVQFALFERYATEYEDTNRIALDHERWEGAQVGDILLAYVQVTLANDRGFPARRQATVELARAEPEINSQLIKLKAMLDLGISDLLIARRDEIGHPDPELAVTFVLDQLGSMLRTRMQEPDMPTRFGQHPDEDFAHEAMCSVCAYIQIELPAEV